MKTIISTIFLIVAVNIFAQSNAQNIFVKLSAENGGKININQSNEIRLAMEKQFSSIANLKGIDGYRIQIYFGNGKNARLQTNQIRSSFTTKYKDAKAHVIYDNPYFRLKVGDFRTKVEANYFLKKIKLDYPEAFIVEDIIDVED